MERDYLNYRRTGLILLRKESNMEEEMEKEIPVHCKKGNEEKLR
jgi:hypothetical protein